MIQAEKPPLTFDELMSTPFNFSAFAMNHLKLNKITRVDLVGPVFNPLKGTYKSYVELKYNIEECYRALIDQLDWANPDVHKSLGDMSKPLPLQDKEGRLTIPVEFFFNNDLEYLKAGNKDRTYSSSITKTPTARAMINKDSKHKVFSTMRILIVVNVLVEKRSGYGYLKEIVVRRADQKLYKFKEGDFSDLHLNDIEDMMLLIAQNKLFNLDDDVIIDFVTAPKMFTRGIIVKNRVEDVQLDSEKLRSAGWGKENREGKRLLQRTNRRDLPRDIPLDRIEVLRYDTKGVKVRKGKMQIEIELKLEQTQQRVSDEVLVVHDKEFNKGTIYALQGSGMRILII
ncbi:hypothetical protein Tco_0592742 [Tanacetum coccineum]